MDTVSLYGLCPSVFPQKDKQYSVAESGVAILRFYNNEVSYRLSSLSAGFLLRK